jgi:hypothetical protein
MKPTRIFPSDDLFIHRFFRMTIDWWPIRAGESAACATSPATVMPAMVWVSNKRRPAGIQPEPIVAPRIAATTFPGTESMQGWIPYPAAGVMETRKQPAHADPATANPYISHGLIDTGALFFSLRSNTLRLQTEMPCAGADQFVKCTGSGYSRCHKSVSFDFLPMASSSKESALSFPTI